MPEENKLGTSVTYLDPNDRRKPVSVQGVWFEPNKATDVAEYLPTKQAEQLVKKLAGNQHFQVDGGPDHSETLNAMEDRRREREREINRTYFSQQAKRRPLEDEPEAPEHYRAPEFNELEGNAPRTDPDDTVPTRTRNKKS